MYPTTTLKPSKGQSATQPLNLRRSALFFAIPALAFILGTYWIWPRLLVTSSLSPFEGFMLVSIVPLALLLTAAIVAYVLDGHPHSWSAFFTRMRFQRVSWRDVGYGLLTAAVGVLGYGALAPVTLWLMNQGLIPLPQQIPVLIDPRIALSPAALTEFTGGPLAGNWSIVIIFSVFLFFNIVGEELWWRGYILPRQEAHFGRWAWLVHGLMWMLFHAFKWWDLLNILPSTLAIAYFAQRTKSSWPPFIAHLLMNGLTLITFIGYVVAGG
ncbi:MAG: CPBP family intramembrane metalloprotease [Ardenticatenaceae bacterium]|nr:CPBP family intramembrane metalloprotease [Ardenticatenaceae bacterium]